MADFKKLTEALNHIYTDLSMLVDEEWDISNDPSSVYSTLEMVEVIAEELDIELSDTREPLNRF